MAPAAGNEGAVDDDGLALDVAAKKIWFGADANPYRFGGETSGTRALGARHGEGSDEIDLVTIGCRVTGVPALRAQSLARAYGKDSTFNPKRANSSVMYFMPALSASVPGKRPQPLLVDSIPVAQRDLGQGDDVLFHAGAVDVLIRFLPRLQWEYRIVLVGKQLRSVIPRQSDAVSLFGLGSVVHLGRGRAARQNADHQSGNTRSDALPRYRSLHH